MKPMQKIAIFGALAMTPIVIALAIWLIPALLLAEKFLSDFQKINDTKPPLTMAQVEQLKGPPVRIDHSESTGLTGDVYHYPMDPYPVGGDYQIVFVNGVVFQSKTVVPTTNKT